MDTLYMFIDESGNLREFIKGSEREVYWILTVMSTPNPFDIGASLLTLRYNLLQNRDACGEDMRKRGAFHASQDPEKTREDVFEILKKNGNDLRVDSVIADRRCHPSELQDREQKIEQEAKLYCQLGKQALQKAFFNDLNLLAKYRHLVVILSNPYGSKKDWMYLAKKFESTLNEIARGFPFALYLHYASFDICAQAVDYFSWAIFRKWREGDQFYYNLIRQSVKSEEKYIWNNENEDPNIEECPLG